MLKCAGVSVVFQEVPDEITLALSLSLCPNHCPGCHSSELADDIGEVVTEEWLDKQIQNNPGISCVGFFGGDNDIERVVSLAKHVKENGLKVAWYSGLTWPHIKNDDDWKYFDFVKVGPYKQDLGGLTEPTTNQIFYKVENVDGNIIFTNNNFKFLKKQLI